MIINKYSHFSVSVLLAIFIYSGRPLKAQVSCTQNLTAARALFNSGRYYDIQGTLQNCLVSGFSKQERIEALRLLSISYLYLDKYPSADSAYLLLLKTSPEYRANAQSDPPDYVYLDESFRHKPVYKWAINGGLNLVFPRILYQYSVSGSTNSIYSHNKQVGFNFGASLEKDITGKISAGIEGQFQYSKCRYNYSSISSRELDSLSVANYGNLELISTWINFPVYIKYKFGDHRIRRYILGGGELNLLMSANYAAKTGGGRDISSTNYMINPHYNFLNYSGFLGFGLSYKSKSISSFAIEFKYASGLSDIVNGHQRYGTLGNDRYQSNIIYYDMLDLTSPQRMDKFMITIKYIHPVYKPKKLE